MDGPAPEDTVGKPSDVEEVVQFVLAGARWQPQILHSFTGVLRQQKEAVRVVAVVVEGVLEIVDGGSVVVGEVIQQDDILFC